MTETVHIKADMVMVSVGPTAGGGEDPKATVPIEGEGSVTDGRVDVRGREERRLGGRSGPIERAAVESVAVADARGGMAHGRGTMGGSGRDDDRRRRHEARRGGGTRLYVLEGGLGSSGRHEAERERVLGLRGRRE